MSMFKRYYNNLGKNTNNKSNNYDVFSLLKLHV